MAARAFDQFASLAAGDANASLNARHARPWQF
jgi:hypothetical protein